MLTFMLVQKAGKLKAANTKCHKLTLASFYIHLQKQTLQGTQELLLFPTLVITKIQEEKKRYSLSY